MVQILSSVFLIPKNFTIVKFINCDLTMYREKGKINPTVVAKGPYLKSLPKSILTFSSTLPKVSTVEFKLNK